MCVSAVIRPPQGDFVRVERLTHRLSVQISEQPFWILLSYASSRGLPLLSTGCIALEGLLHRKLEGNFSFARQLLDLLPDYVPPVGAKGEHPRHTIDGYGHRAIDVTIRPASIRADEGDEVG